MARKNISFDSMVDFVHRVLGDDHWYPDDGVPKLVKDPNDFRGSSYPLRIALYATFSGPVPARMSVKSACGDNGCVHPLHATLVSSCRGTGLVDMGNTADAYKQLGRNWPEL